MINIFKLMVLVMVAIAFACPIWTANLLLDHLLMICGAFVRSFAY